MTEYLLLIAPSANRVYADRAPDLVAAEARVLLGSLADVETAERTSLAGVPYVRVATTDDPRVRPALAHLSGGYAAFARQGELLRPVELPVVERYPSDLTTVQKYPGKTNEQWTRLCLNVTAAATRRPERLLDGSLAVLDPMCGRGTTLNVALSLGLSVTGIDVDRRDFAAYEMFAKTWLRGHRLKHTVESTSLRRAGTTFGHRLAFTTAPDKTAFKAGDTATVTYLQADARRADELLRAGSVDAIVTDTPYGVQHGAHGEDLARSPLPLLAQSLGPWRRVLRTGGAIGLSVNRHVAPVPDLWDLLRDNGFEPVEHGEAFRHRVDSSIDRDLVVARAV